MPVYRNDTEEVIIENFKNENGSLMSYRIEPGESLSTIYLLTNANLTLVSANPYYNPLQQAIQTISSLGSGDDKEVVINLDTKIISIINFSEALVTVFLQSTSNTPGMYCYASTERIIITGHNVNKLILRFSVAGSVYVEQRKK